MDNTPQTRLVKMRDNDLPEPTTLQDVINAIEWLTHVVEGLAEDCHRVMFDVEAIRTELEKPK
jgi:hypothetical protein